MDVIFIYTGAVRKLRITVINIIIILYLLNYIRSFDKFKMKS